jgi:hypothetical protein
MFHSVFCAAVVENLHREFSEVVARRVRQLGSIAEPPNALSLVERTPLALLVAAGKPGN